ncbi:MAG: PadR family transcriptional regulator [Gemmatimonadetes bacterium]|nr:PadR family transcriptional regulator [Gemmatimonadota bacterium]
MTDLSQLKPQWFQILLAIADRELHGLGIMKTVLEHTEGQMKLWPATLYGSLKKLSEQGLIEETERPADPATDGDRRRFYTITGLGREALAAEVARLAKYVRVAESKQIVTETGS